MFDHSPSNGVALPERPSLRHLKGQAADLHREGHATSMADAHFQIALRYGFASWSRLKAHVESTTEVALLKEAIDANDLERVTALMSANPKLHEAPIGYRKDGPLTWVAECRVPWEPPGTARLAMAKWMIEQGSDVHRGGDAPLMRAALNGDRVRMMELLVQVGANVNAAWHGYYPIIFAPCETVDPVPLKWLLDHGADPNCGGEARWSGSGHAHRGSALDFVIGTYSRHPARLSACIDVLLNAGARTRYDDPAVMSMLRGRTEDLAAMLDADSSLASQRYSELDLGVTAERRLTLRGGTLLHVAAEYGVLDAAKALLERGADVNAHAEIDADGVGGQTPIFHAATQFGDAGLPMLDLLLERGADLSVRARLPGHYERAEETVECTPLGYAMLFPEGVNPAVAILREHGGVE